MNYPKYLLLFLLFSFFCFSSYVLAADGDLDPVFFTGINYRDVRDIDLQADGKLIIGGEFDDVVGFPAHRIARLKANGDVDPTFYPGTGAIDDVLVVKALPDGKVLIGGVFTSYNGFPANHIARLNSDGSFDTTFQIGSGANFGNVTALAITADNKIFVGGNFQNFNGNGKPNLVKLNYDGTQDLSFAIPTAGNILSIVPQPDGKLLIGGNFGIVNGTGRSRIARLNADGSLDKSFQLIGASGGSGVIVNDIALLANGQVMAAGKFTKFNNIDEACIVRLNGNGSVDTSFTASGVNSINKIGVQSDGNVIAVGSFDSLQSQNIVIKRFGATGAEIPFSSNPPIFNTTYSVRIAADNKVIVSGFRYDQHDPAVGGAESPGVLKLNTDGTRDTLFVTRTGAGASARDMFYEAATNTIVYNGGGGGLEGNGVSRLLPEGTVDRSFRPGIFGSAMAAQPDGRYVVGGIFTNTGVYVLRRVNNDGSIDPSFKADTGINPTGTWNVYRMASQPDGKIVMVGNFASVNGTPRKGFARLNADGSLDTSFAPAISADEWEIRGLTLQPDGKILIGGKFITGSTSGSTTVHSVSRYNLDGTIDRSFAPAIFNLNVNVLAQRNGRIFVGGFFDTVNGAQSKRFARLYFDGSIDTAFHSPAFGDGSGDFGRVDSILPMRDGRVLVGGQFATVGGNLQSCVARLNADGSFDPYFRPTFSGFGSEVDVILQQPNGKIVLSGAFDVSNGVPRINSTRLLYALRTAPFDFDGDGKSDISLFRPSIATWFAINSSDGAFSINQWGSNGDKTVPADYDGDGKTDLAIWRPSNGVWFWINSSTGTVGGNQFGLKGDIPAPADYDGDGKADIMIYRPSGGQWWTYSSSNSNVSVTFFGAAEDKPTIGDFDGDGMADVALFRPSNGTWYRINSSTGSVAINQFGLGGDKPVASDYDGDGKSDIAIWRPSNGAWYWVNSANGTIGANAFGLNEDQPAPGDYDGDGKSDLAVYRPSQGAWYLLKTTQGFSALQFGTTGDIATPGSYAY